MGENEQRAAIFSIVLVVFISTSCSIVEKGAEYAASHATEDVEETRADFHKVSPSLPGDTMGERPTATVIPDSGWRNLQEGMEFRIVNLTSNENLLIESIYMLRIDPLIYRFDIAYKPGDPKSLDEWLSTTGALVVVNGGFFTESFEATGAIVSDGHHWGTSYEGFGGMFAVTSSGPELRWLAERPYNSNELILGALQSFPMLILPGGVPYFAGEDQTGARRTVIAQDRQGRFVFLIATLGNFTLATLSQFLVKSDLDLDRALNLDGGASSGFLVAGGEVGISPYSLLPAIIAIYPSH